MPSSDRITIKISAATHARLSERAAQWAVSRSRAVEMLLDSSDGVPLDAADHTESLAILSRLARADRVGAAIALERALRSADAVEAEVDELDELRERRKQP